MDKESDEEDLESNQTDQIISAIRGSPSSLVPGSAPSLRIDPALCEQVGNQWILRTLLQENVPQEFSQSGDINNQNQVKDKQWAIMPVVEDTVRLAFMPEYSDEVIPFDILVGRKCRKRGLSYMRWWKEVTDS